LTLGLFFLIILEITVLNINAANNTTIINIFVSFIVNIDSGVGEGEGEGEGEGDGVEEGEREGYGVFDGE
jgi:hypothetical protein